MIEPRAAVDPEPDSGGTHCEPGGTLTTSTCSAVTIVDMDATSTPTDEDPASVWELRIGVYCTAEQARNLTDSIQLMLCPDPLHKSACPIPWSTAHWQLDEQEAVENYPELIEQARIEQ